MQKMNHHHHHHHHHLCYHLYARYLQLYLKQTMFLGYTVLQLCIYSLCYL